MQLIFEITVPTPTTFSTDYIAILDKHFIPVIYGYSGGGMGHCKWPQLLLQAPTFHRTAASDRCDQIQAVHVLSPEKVFHT